MSTQRQNSYDDDDMRQLLEEIEELEEGKVSIRMTAAADCGAISKKIKVAKGRAKDLGIPSAVLNGLLKTRRLERQIASIADDLPDDLAEMWEDANGQFAWLQPIEGEPKASPGKRAAKRAVAAAKAHQDAELAEGDRVLSGLTN